ncbi:phosphatase PAP2 family protein [Ancylomarina subtilis]|uniref:phosphatase PAP2 family protein n=1 Tax=Ancylomarina subtilis TaxID=1639035 RepID=UPI001A91C5EC|nr:phosphatase PAP2 family protein [Ancylomarina subtilis]
MLNLKNTVIPISLFTIGFIGIESDALKSFNREVREEVRENIDRQFTADDFLQYAPGAMVYANDLLGVKGKHKLQNQLLIHGTSLFIMGAIVNTLKYSEKVERPDHSSFNSFPSGHTAMAFANAEFLYQEYKDKSIWYGIAGYTIASSIGVFRIVNNRHWVTDVLAGAGIGIFSTKLSYFLYDRVFAKKNNKTKTTLISPFYNSKQLGLCCSITF